MTDQIPVQMRLEWTPNPNTIKYMVNRTLVERGAANFSEKAEAEKAPLPGKLFAINGVTGIMIGRNFVTVTKTEGADWEEVHNHASETIQAHLEAEESILGEYELFLESSKEASSQEEAIIRRILENEIRPAVARDGGDITFERYEQGVLYLSMKGSCSGCPSSTMTLKMGIEARLRDELPDLVEVVAI